MNRRQAEGVAAATFILERSGKIGRKDSEVIMRSLDAAGHKLATLARGMSHVVNEMDRGTTALVQELSAKKACPWYYKVLHWFRSLRG